MTQLRRISSEQFSRQGKRGRTFTPDAAAQPAPDPFARALTPAHPDLTLVSRHGQAMAVSAPLLRRLPLAPVFGRLRSRCRSCDLAAKKGVLVGAGVGDERGADVRDIAQCILLTL